MKIVTISRSSTLNEHVRTSHGEFYVKATASLTVEVEPTDDVGSVVNWMEDYLDWLVRYHAYQDIARASAFKAVPDALAMLSAYFDARPSPPPPPAGIGSLAQPN